MDKEITIPLDGSLLKLFHPAYISGKSLKQEFKKLAENNEKKLDELIPSLPLPTQYKTAISALIRLFVKALTVSDHLKNISCEFCDFNSNNYKATEFLLLNPEVHTYRAMYVFLLEYTRDPL